jgi:hypothetical protein
LSAVAEKLETSMQRVVQLLSMALNATTAPAERLNALRALDRFLDSIGADSHDLIDRFSGDSGISDEDMQRIFDAGYAKRAEEEETKRRQAVAVVTPSAGAAVDDESGVNGYVWREIAGHCAAHVGTIRNDWEQDFIRSIAMNFVTNKNFKPTIKQRPILARIFRSWFRGEIL